MMMMMHCQKVKSDTKLAIFFKGGISIITKKEWRVLCDKLQVSDKCLILKTKVGYKLELKKNYYVIYLEFLSYV